MKEIKIKVEENPIDKSISIFITGALFQVNTFFDESTLAFFLDSQKADSLAFHIQSILQDQERRKELKDGKAGEELREMRVDYDAKDEMPE